MRTKAASVPLLTVILLASPMNASAAPSHTRAAEHAASPGFYVSGHGQVVGSSMKAAGLVTDAKGGDHVIAWNPARHAAFRYFVRKHHATHFTSTKIKFNPKHRRHAFALELLSPNGRSIKAVLVDCKGVFTSTASLRAAKLPKPTLAVPGRGCDPDDGLAVDLAGAVPGPSGRVVLLVRDDGEFVHSGPTPAALQVWRGRPGSAFHLAPAQPTGAANGVNANTLRVVSFDRDPVTHALDIVLETESSTATTLSVSTWTTSSTWSDPAVVATLPKGHSSARDYGVADTTVYDGKLTMGVQPTVPKPGHPHRTVPGAYLLVTSDHGATATTESLPHSAIGDGDLRLLTNPRNGHLHAAFDRMRGKQPGIFEEKQVDTTWSPLSRLAAGTNRYLEALALTPHGQAVAGYIVA